MPLRIVQLPDTPQFAAGPANGMRLRHLEQWREWAVGADRDLIWRWFDERHALGLVEGLRERRVEVGGHQAQDGEELEAIRLSVVRAAHRLPFVIAPVS